MKQVLMKFYEHFQIITMDNQFEDGNDGLEDSDVLLIQIEDANDIENRAWLEPFKPCRILSELSVSLRSTCD